MVSQAVQVLLVEDNPGDVDLTREMLGESRLPVDLNVAADGAEAMAYLLGKPPHENAPRPHLVLLDLNLPGMHGRQILAEIRRHPGLRSLPTIVLTSSDAESDVVSSYALGANCYVVKPGELDSFRDIVTAIEDFWFAIAELPARTR